jgi:hypothetical protein
VTYALQLSLGIVFLVAAAPKVRRPGAFAATVAEYRIVPTVLVRAVALTLIALESFLALAFLSGWLVPIAFPLAALALSAFFLSVAVNLHRGRTIRCGCFGDTREAISGRSLVRLAALMVVLAVLLVSRSAGLPGVTVASLVASGATGFAYVAQMGAVAIFVLLVGQWILALPEVASIVRAGSSRGSPVVHDHAESHT